MRRTILYIEPQCPVGSYEEDLSTGENVCVPCPTNSFSTMEGSRECSCFEGHFRTALEEPNHPCTCEIYSCNCVTVTLILSLTACLKRCIFHVHCSIVGYILAYSVL